MTQKDDPWIEGYDHGFHEAGCDLCGWYGWTDTGGCPRCVYCPECGEAYTDEEPCACNRAASGVKCRCCLDTDLKWEDDRDGKGWCACQAKP